MIPEILPVNNYSGNGSTTNFDFDFYIENENQLKVYYINEDEEEFLLERGVDYSVNYFDSNNVTSVTDYALGGYITFPLGNSSYSVLAEGEKISLRLDIPFSQDTDYENSSLLSLHSLEFSLDYLTRLTQILKRGVDRSLKYKEGVGGSEGFDTNFPSPEPYLVICWDSEGKKLENRNIRGIVDIQKTSTSELVDTYTVYYTDNTTSTYQITNGVKGDQGEQGIQGETGADGAYVVDISPVEQIGHDVTYRMTYSNGNTYDFVVTNGSGSMKWHKIKTTDWVFDSVKNKYKYQFNGAYSVAGVYKGTIQNRSLIENIDIDVSYGLTTIYSLDTFNGYLLMARTVDEEIESQYIHEQTTASKVWVINHNLNTKPSVTVVDENDKEIRCKKVYTSANTVTLYFNTALKGKAYLNYTR